MNYLAFFIITNFAILLLLGIEDSSDRRHVKVWLEMAGGLSALALAIWVLAT